MLKMNMWNGNIASFSRWPFSLVVIVIAALPASIVCSLMFDGVFGHIGYYILLGIVGTLVISVLTLLKRYELVANVIIIINLYVDWYLGYSVISITLAAILLFLFFFARSLQLPWVKPRALWLWALFLLLPIPAVIQGSQGFYDFAFYYLNVFCAALVMFWLGILVVRDGNYLRNTLRLLALFGAFLAVQTIVQEITGIVVFSTPHLSIYLSQVSNFALTDSGGVNRIGSYFYNPDWNGAFFAMIVFIPLGLLNESSSLLQRFLYASEIFLMLLALLFTYSIGSLIGSIGGMFAFILFSKHGYSRVLVTVPMIIVGIVLAICFSTQINLLYQHASNPNEMMLRLGGWQTAINIVRAFPITGIGLGLVNYEQRAEAYRAAGQYIPLVHPHDSYLELGAMAGCPVLIVFSALLLFALWQAWRNWTQADTGTRYLLSGGIASVIALSVNSVSINGWTLPPLAAICWLILGAITSPFIVRKSSLKYREEKIYNNI